MYSFFTTKVCKATSFWHAQSGCSSETGAVCGTNGETYQSECHAWSVGGVLVDYVGACRVLPFQAGQLAPACLFYNKPCSACVCDIS